MNSSTERSRAVVKRIAAQETPGLPKRLILFHGNGKCGDYYEPLALKLAALEFATALVTLPGYGPVPPLDHPTWPAILEDLIPVVRQELGEGGTLVGFSLGGLVAFLLAAHLQDKVHELVLVEPGIVPWPWLAQRLAENYRSRRVNQERGVFHNTGSGYRRIHDVASFPAKAMELALACEAESDPSTKRALVLGAADLHPLPFEKVNSRVLLVRGSSSGLLMKAAQFVLSRKFQNASTAVIENAGHWVANENDAELAKTIDTFAGRSPDTH
jgi:pimeloyl-ACP methyl ester carboxylesterase